MNDERRQRIEALMEEAARVANEELGPALDQLWGGNMTGVQGAALLMQAAAYAKTVPPPLSRVLVMRVLYETWKKPSPTLMTALVMVAATGFLEPGFRWAVPSRALWLTLCGKVWDELEAQKSTTPGAKG